jgi:hypothetical protein
MWGVTSINDRIKAEKDLARKKALELVKKHNQKNISCIDVVIDSKTTIQVTEERFKKLGKEKIIQLYKEKYTKKY